MNGGTFEEKVKMKSYPFFDFFLIEIGFVGSSDRSYATLYIYIYTYSDINFINLYIIFVFFHLSFI